MKNSFFLVIGILLMLSIVGQCLSVFWLYDRCDSGLYVSPLLAGISLLVSLVPNLIWIRAGENVKRKSCSLFVWVLACIVGIAAVGSTVGQTHLYTRLGCNVEYVAIVQYLSLGMLMLSLSLPHGYKYHFKNEKVGVTPNQTEEFLEVRELQFKF